MKIRVASPEGVPIHLKVPENITAFVSNRVQ